MAESTSPDKHDDAVEGVNLDAKPNDFEVVDERRGGAIACPFPNRATTRGGRGDSHDDED